MIIVAVILSKTTFGYELKATGMNANAAKYAGMNEKRNIILAMAIAGALAGLGATLLYLTDIDQWQTTATSVPAVGFSGIAVAFLGGLNPFGTLFAALFIQHITLGGGLLAAYNYPHEVASLISSIIIYLCAFAGFFKYVLRNRFLKKATRGGNDE